MKYTYGDGDTISYVALGIRRCLVFVRKLLHYERDKRRPSEFKR